MAIVILGKSTCKICKRVINLSDHYYSFPAFVVNKKNLLYFFNDESFHSDCLANHPLGVLAKEYSDLSIKKNAPPNRICMINGNRIQSEKDDIALPLLTIDANDFLYPYNFAHIDKNNLKSWHSRDIVMSQLKALHDSDNWKESGNKSYLGKIISALESA